MPDLIEWLRAQLDEDERGVYEWIRPADNWLTSSLRSIHEWTERAGAQRVLAEIAAKRAILDLHAMTTTWHASDEQKRPGAMPQGFAEKIQALKDHGIARHRCKSCTAGSDYPCATLQLLAQPYAARPGWRDEWATGG